MHQQVEKEGISVVIAKFIAEMTKQLRGFNVKQNMNQMQIELFCEDFLSEYKYESMADLKICLKRARLGKYGSHFNSIDSLKIMEWFHVYLDEKAQEREKMHNKAKQIENKPFEFVTKKLTEEQIQALKDEIKPTRETTSGKGLGSVMRERLGDL